MPVCVLAGVAVVVAAARWLPSVFAGSPAAGRGRPPGAPHPAAPAVRAGGRVVFVTQSGELAVANPDGSHLARAGGLGVVGNALGASPDNRYLSLVNGQVISFRGVRCWPATRPKSRSAATPRSRCRTRSPVMSGSS